MDGNKTTALVKSIFANGLKQDYAYDTVGNIVSVRSTDYLYDYAYSFEYDDLNQLVRENNQRFGKTYTYTYVNGNITERKEYAYTTGELGEVLDTKTWSYNDHSWSDLLTNYNGISISYDEIGNPTTIGSQSLSWNGRQLQEITDSEKTYTYLYNTDGQRVSKTVNGVTTEYFYNGEILAGQKTGNETLVFMYDNNGDIFGFVYDGHDFYYVKNAQNDVVGLVSGGNIVAYYFYDAWGNAQIVNDAGYAIYDMGHPAYINPIRYRSYYYDHETNLYFLNSRYYSPDLCRFLNADDADVLEEDQDSMIEENLFAYCLNNPVNMADDDGTVAWWIAAAVTGAAWDAAFYCVEAAITGNFSWKGLGKAALKGAVTGLAFGAVGKIAGKAVKAVKVARTAKNTAKTGKATKSVANISKTAKTVSKVKKTNKVAGKITGYTKHGLSQAIGRDGGRGVKASAILDAVRNPTKTVFQDGGKVKYIGKQAVVVLNSEGRVITTYAKSSKYWRCYK